MFGFSSLGLRPLVSLMRTQQVPNFALVSSNLVNNSLFGQTVRFMNRNARRPKKANHGKRPCSHARRHEKRGKLTSVAYREKIFGFW